MTEAEFNQSTRLVFDRGSLSQLGALAAELGCKRAFLVTDEGMTTFGYAERAIESLRAAGLDVQSFAGVRQNPSTDDVDNCVAALGDYDADLLVGLGGGSSIDVAKGCAFLRAGGGRMEDYWGVGKAKGQLLPLIAVPTTAGTGTEVQSFALIEQEGTHQKMACGDPQAAPRIALLDPDLSLTMPRSLTASSGLDAIGHAVETAVTSRRSAVSQLYSTAAFKLADKYFPRVLDDPDDVDARGHMLKAATFAGIAIENSMLGAAHSMANPLTAHFRIVHGQAVGMSLPHVVRFNAADPQAAELYFELAKGAGICTEATPRAIGVERLVHRLSSLVRAADYHASLVSYGVRADDIPRLAEEATRQWTAQFNPREVGVEQFVELFTAACPPPIDRS